MIAVLSWLLVSSAFASTAETVRGELQVKKGSTIALRVTTSDQLRGTYCLAFSPASLAKKKWLVNGLNVEVRARMPSSLGDCAMVEQIKPVVFDPGGATVRQGPVRALPSKKSK